MRDSTSKSISDFIKLKNNADAPSPSALVAVAIILFALGWYSGLGFVELLLISIFEFVFSVFLIIKTYNKKISDKHFNLYNGLYGISLSVYSQLLFFCANYKTIGIQTFLFSVLLLFSNLIIVFALLSYVCIKIKKGTISKTIYISSSFAGIGAIVGIVIAKQYRGETMFISNIVYISSSMVFSAFILCLIKFLLYQLLEFKDSEQKKNIILKLLERVIS